jgi:hypothetical protein
MSRRLVRYFGPGVGPWRTYFSLLREALPVPSHIAFVTWSGQRALRPAGSFYPWGTSFPSDVAFSAYFVSAMA